MTIKILAISDNRLPQYLNVEFLKLHHGDCDILISCGDMDVDYIDFIASVLNLPLYYVRGNHDHYYTPYIPGGINLHRRFERYQGYRFVGLEGSMRYNENGDAQYAEFDMAWFIMQMMPRLLTYRLIKGYGADVVVTHSPPRHIHDREDRPHRGFKSMRWLMRWTRPRYLIHGHIDIYDNRQPRETRYHYTTIINVNPSRVITLE